VARTVTDVGRSISAAVTGNRPLEEFEIAPIVMVGLLLASIATLGFLAPAVVVWPIAALALWMAVTFLAEAWTLWRRR
jgi:hypothetical protein